jgi:hypothetical protein
MIKKYNHYIILCLLAFWYACAQITPLSGGEKDTAPPQVLKTIPDNKSTSVSPQKVYIEFDEFIKLNNIQKQFLSSPALKNQPKFKLKGKVLIIELSDTLQPNTTYTFSFGNSIADITENNPIEDFQYVFSTGAFIDSLQIGGTVLDAFSLKPDEKLYVLLYKNLTDTFFKTTPSYVGITQKNGTFKIKHIKHGTYKILALKDVNANYLYDLPNEKIGFLTNKILLDSNLFDIKIRTYIPENCTPKIKTTKELANGVFLVEFDHIQHNDFNAQILFPENTKTITYKNGDSLLLMSLNLKNNDSISVNISNANISNTINFRYRLPKDSSVQVSLVKSISTTSKPNFTFLSSLPVTVDHTKILLLNDSLPEEFLVNTTAENRWTIHINNAKNKIYKLYYLPGSIKNIYNKVNDDTIRFDLRVQDENNFGNLKVNINPQFDLPFFIILKDKNDKELSRTATYTGKTTVEFLHLVPNNYSIYCVIDENNNNIWDCGNIEQNILPERVIGFKNNPIKILQNWDQETDWNIMP